jgi:hypothetical protein
MPFFVENSAYTSVIGTLIRNLTKNSIVMQRSFIIQLIQLRRSKSQVITLLRSRIDVITIHDDVLLEAGIRKIKKDSSRTGLYT